jgi:hypothetical protein
MYDLGYRDAKNYREIMKTYEPNVMKYFKMGVGLDKVFTRNGGKPKDDGRERSPWKVKSCVLVDEGRLLVKDSLSLSTILIEVRTGCRLLDM